MNKLFVIGLCVVLLGGIFVGVTLDNDLNENKEVNMNYEYQGPVPEGYDEQHFRNTGETKPLVEVIE